MFFPERGRCISAWTSILGNQKAFVDYMKALSDYVAEAAPEKTIRMGAACRRPDRIIRGFPENSAAGMGYGLDRSAGNV